MDLSMVARIGESATVDCTPGYAAPETALAVLHGHERMRVNEKVDSWALGVIAYELLLGRVAFGTFREAYDVCFCNSCFKSDLLCCECEFLSFNFQDFGRNSVISHECTHADLQSAGVTACTAMGGRPNICTR
jgi:serine/threonine protein kinase